MSTPDAAASARRTPASHAVPVHKVLNNNVVIAIDESGRERVLMGRGLAFGLKPDDVLDPAKVEKTFILDNGADGERERRLLTDVPYPIVVSDSMWVLAAAAARAWFARSPKRIERLTATGGGMMIGLGGILLGAGPKH